MKYLVFLLACASCGLGDKFKGSSDMMMAPVEDLADVADLKAPAMPDLTTPPDLALPLAMPDMLGSQACVGMAVGTPCASFAARNCQTSACMLQNYIGSCRADGSCEPADPGCGLYYAVTLDGAHFSCYQSCVCNNPSNPNYFCKSGHSCTGCDASGMNGYCQ